MIDNSILYTVNKSSLKDIKEHLHNCSDLFIPKLETYTDINKYAEKLKKKAVCFEAYDKKKLVGLSAIYLNEEGNYGFITNLSVDSKYRGKGIAKELMNQSLSFLAINGIEKIQLEVFKSNKRAIRFYSKFLFNRKEIKSDVLIMERKVHS